MYYRCDWLQWQLDCYDSLLQWLFDYLDSLIALTASLHCYDSLTAMTAWLLWQLDCYDSLNAMTAWSQLFEKWFGTDLTLEKLLHLKNIITLLYDLRLWQLLWWQLCGLRCKWGHCRRKQWKKWIRKIWTKYHELCWLHLCGLKQLDPNEIKQSLTGIIPC